MNSFALLQEEVEDDGANITQQIPKLDEPQDLHEQVDRLNIDDSSQSKPSTGQPALMNGTVDGNHNEGQTKAEGGEQGTGVDGDKENEKSKEEQEEKTLTLEEYLAQKKALSSEVKGLSVRQARRANDGQDGFKRMDKLKTKDERGEEGMTGIAVKKDLHENKGLKDSTHATVARNAEIQKFFQRDPDDNRRQNSSYRGRGRGGPRGGMGSRGSYYSNSYDRMNSGNSYNSSNGSGNDQPGFHHSDSGTSGGHYNNRGRGGYERGGRGGGRSFDRGARTGSYERGGRGGYRSNYSSNYNNSQNTMDSTFVPPAGDDVTANAAALPTNDTLDMAADAIPPTNISTGEAVNADQSDNTNGADGGFQPREGGFQRGGRGGYRGGRGAFERGGGRFGSDRGGRGRGGYDRRGGYGGRGDSRGGRGGRGGYRGYDRSMPRNNNVVVVPNVDDVSAFPAL